MCAAAALKSRSLLFSFSSKVQSELRATNLEELKITVETYYGEVTDLSVQNVITC